MKLLPRLPAYEVQDLSPASIVLMVVGLFASVILSFAVVAGILAWQRPTERSVPAVEEQQLRAGPRLEVDAAEDAQHLKQAASKRLQGYAWTDRKAGEVHIPIDRAIELLAKQGWPDPDTGSVKP
jgi:hypothetical protein